MIVDLVKDLLSLFLESILAKMLLLELQFDTRTGLFNQMSLILHFLVVLLQDTFYDGMNLVHQPQLLVELELGLLILEPRVKVTRLHLLLEGGSLVQDHLALQGDDVVSLEHLKSIA